MRFIVQRVWVTMVSLRDNESGITAIEYGLMAGLLATAVIAAAGVLGTSIETAFRDVAGKLAP